MFKKIISFVLVIMLTLSVVPTFAANNEKVFSDVPSGYWGKASIDYISEKGYMVGYGDRFGILDNITEGQYVAVLCRIFGYEKQSPLTCEGPARELGLLKENETINVAANLKRGDIAKYTVRAFELLNPNATYPDYLEAYNGMITDYDSLKEEIKPIALKCVEKGLLAGGPDGSFNPNDETTRAQAAAFIHRILEQSERNKVMPVFAEPDPEFEAFMATSKEVNTFYFYPGSENLPPRPTPGAEQFITMENAHPVPKVIDGKIIYRDNEGRLSLLPTYFNKESNKEAYETIRNLVMYAKDNGHHVRLLLSSDHSALFIKYFENEFYGIRNPYTYGTNFCLIMSLTKRDIINHEQTKYTYYTWDIRKLTKDTTEDWAAVNYKEPDMMKALEIAFKSIYGDTLGQKVFDYAINDYDYDRKDKYYDNYGVLHTYENLKVEYFSGFEGFELCNYNEEQSINTHFTTNNK